MCLLCYILMMRLILCYIDAIPRALYTSIFVPLCSALVKRLQIQLPFLHINQQSALCNNYTRNCLYNYEGGTVVICGHISVTSHIVRRPCGGNN